MSNQTEDIRIYVNNEALQQIENIIKRYMKENKYFTTTEIKQTNINQINNNGSGNINIH